MLAVPCASALRLIEACFLLPCLLLPQPKKRQGLLRQAWGQTGRPEDGVRRQQV